MRWLFYLTCPVCGDECRPVTVGKPVHGTQTAAVVHCGGCDCEWEAMVRLLPVGRRAANAMRRIA